MCPFKTALAHTKCTCLRHKYVPIQSCTCTCQVHMLETQICTHSRLHLHTPNACVLKASDLGGLLSPISAKETAKVSPPVLASAGFHMSPKQEASSSMALGGTALLFTPEPAPATSAEALHPHKCPHPIHQGYALCVSHKPPSCSA
jgi:hypothetical protein